MIILNEHPFFLIFGPKANFWVGQEMDGVGQFFRLFEISFPWAFQKCMKLPCLMIILVILGHFWVWLELSGEGQNCFGLKAGLTPSQFFTVRFIENLLKMIKNAFISS